MLKWPIACSSPPVILRIKGWQNCGNAADMKPRMTAATAIVTDVLKPCAFIINTSTHAKNKLCPVVKKIFLNLVIRAKTRFKANPSIRVKETSKPYVLCASAVAASGEAITPVMWKPFWNSLLKFCREPVMAEAPIPKMRKPISVFEAPVNTSVADFL
ncbi:hypothetical protein D3C76_1287460 [compost metagenome]